MVERLVVVGAGGFGRETLDVVEALNAEGNVIDLLGVVDDSPRRVDLEKLAARGIDFLGTEAEWISNANGNESFVVAIGSPVVRAQVAHRIQLAGFSSARPLLHPRSVIGSQAQIGRGVVVTSGVQVSTNVKLGEHVHLNPGCIIGHDAVLEDVVSINPGAIISGNVMVGQQVMVGAGAVVLQGLTVADRCTVGAAACVTRNVPSGATVVGIPARDLAGPQAHS